MPEFPALPRIAPALIAFAAAMACALAPPAAAHERDWEDLPPAARDVPVPQDTGILVREVAPGVHMVTDGLYQALFAVTGDGVVVVDAPPSIGPRLSQAIAATTDKPVIAVIYTHSHIDHIGAADQFGPDVQRIASVPTRDKLARLADPRRPVPTQVVGAGSTRMRFGTTEVQLDLAGAFHEPGNLIVLFPQGKVLMMVDIVYPGWVPFTNLGMAEDVQGFIDAHDVLLGYDFAVFVGGHLSRPGTRADVETAKTYVTDLVAAARAAQGKVDFLAVAGETGFANRWLLVKTWMDRVADACTATMLGKWEGKLGGASVSTPGHCWIMQEHLNINGLPAAETAPVRAAAP
ncbi:MBL fold metallo-hydrolase [Erythrobacter sp. CCH5-A1]|jgi:glyoxylase-like metal-dependent hydrolase (beta-lactamase superfamily II)|uniref:MBL fold metallo-hydrolase n=1 Tax=Erythrobacter sp. CCH5-A1 TaxID=1768792 RepID=UPI00082BE0C9|nr:MBL fold metallo-hydrolase [Erythrobacter sp. CCH5-A1]